MLWTTNGVPYGMITVLYDTNYDYEFGETQAREDVMITQTPQFLSEPLELRIKEGNTARLPCMVNRLAGFVLLWRKNGKIISVGNQIFDRKDSRIRIEEKDNGNTLIISGTDHNDQGDYICSVSAYKRTEIHHRLLIKEEPPVLTITPSEVMTILEGKQAQMICRDKAKKHLTVKWRRCDGGPYLNEYKDGLLKFEAVTRSHSGCYECEAQDASLRAELIVEYSPNVHIAKIEDALTCRVESKPEADIDWLLDGKKIDGERKDIKVTTKKGESRLQLVEAETSRNFTCRATNKYGMKKDHVQVKGTKEIVISQFDKHAEGTSLFQEEGSGMTSNEIENTLRKMNGDKVTKKAKTYFARIPAEYTLPHQKKDPPLIKNRFPKDADEFLKLLRIFHNGYLSNGNEDHKETELLLEDTTESNLLRSTHSYDGNLEDQIKGELSVDKSMIVLENIPVIEGRKYKKENSFTSLNDSRKEANNLYENKAMNIKDLVDIKEEKLNKDRSPQLHQPSTNEKSKGHPKRSGSCTEIKKKNVNDNVMDYGKGRYLTEGNLLEKGHLIQEVDGSLSKSEKTAVLRGHHSLSSSLHNLTPNILLSITQDGADSVENSIHRDLTDIIGDYDSVQQKNTEINNMKHIKLISDNSNVVPIYFDTKDNELLQAKNAAEEKLRHNEVANSELHERPEEVSCEQTKDDIVPTYMSKQDHEIDNSKGSEIPLEEQLQSARYLKEDQFMENKKDKKNGLKEKENKILRGYHAIQNTLQEDIGSPLKSALMIHQDNINDNYDSKSQDEKLVTPVTTESPYPDEIMGMERLYFRRKQTEPLKAANSMQTVLTEFKEQEKLRTKTLDNVEVQIRGDHLPSRDLDDTRIGKETSIENEIDTENSNEPFSLRGDHSYNKKLEEDKALKGMHPFRGILFRLP